MNKARYPPLPARPVRVECPGAVSHVLTRGSNRQAVLKDEQDRTTYLEKLFRYCQEKETYLLCYCLLSNHVHLLLETPEGNLSKLMQAFQTSYTVYFNRRHRHTGHVFEQRYKAFLDEDFVEAVWRTVKKKGQTIGGGSRLADIVREVCEVVGIEREELRRTVKEERIQRGRELLMHVARRHSRASLREIGEWLGARDLSTVSHGVRRAEERLHMEGNFRQQAEEIVRRLSRAQYGR